MTWFIDGYLFCLFFVLSEIQRAPLESDDSAPT